MFHEANARGQGATGRPSNDKQKRPPAPALREFHRKSERLPTVSLASVNASEALEGVQTPSEAFRPVPGRYTDRPDEFGTAEAARSSSSLPFPCSTATKSPLRPPASVCAVVGGWLVRLMLHIIDHLRAAPR